MPGRKHHFQCGHFGWGQYCHRCKQAEKLEKKSPDGHPLRLEAARLRALRDKVKG